MTIYSPMARRLGAWAVLRVWGAIGVGVAGLGGLPGCGGSTPQAEAPPPPLDDDEGAPAAAPSSGKVKAAVEAIQAGDFAKAKGILDGAVKEAPRDAQAAFYLGVAIEGLGDAKGAAGQYKIALGLDGKLTEASVNLSGVLLDLDDAKGALAVAEAGLRGAPKNPALLRNRAVGLDATGSPDALAAFRAAVAASPNDGETHFLLADALARGGDGKGAVAELEPLVKSEDVAVLASAARLLGRLKAFDACIAALDRAVTKEGAKQSSAELRVARGLCRHGKKDDKGAQADFEGAIGANPEFAPAHYYLGMQKKEAGDAKGARAELQKAADLDPKSGMGAAAKKALTELK